MKSPETGWNYLKLRWKCIKPTWKSWNYLKPSWNTWNYLETKWGSLNNVKVHETTWNQGETKWKELDTNMWTSVKLLATKKGLDTTWNQRDSAWYNLKPMYECLKVCESAWKCWYTLELTWKYVNILDSNVKVPETSRNWHENAYTTRNQCKRAWNQHERGLRQPETNRSVKLLETKVKAGEIAETNMKLPETTKKPQTNCNLSSFYPKRDRLWNEPSTLRFSVGPFRNLHFLCFMVWENEK
jgi:hypothetical protein